MVHWLNRMAMFAENRDLNFNKSQSAGQVVFRTCS